MSAPSPCPDPSAAVPQTPSLGLPDLLPPPHPAQADLSQMDATRAIGCGYPLGGTIATIFPQKAPPAPAPARLAGRGPGRAAAEGMGAAEQAGPAARREG
jgi:hypothetical protein